MQVELSICHAVTSSMSRKNYESEATELALALGTLVRRLRATTPSQAHELSWTQKAVMLRLEAEGPATTADLARAEGVKPQSMGAIVTALEEMGFVERTPHPTDGRQMYVALSARGASMRNEIGVAKRTWLAAAIQRLDAGEKENLAAAIALIKRLGEV